MARDMGQAPKAQREVDAPEKARFGIKRRAESLQSRSPFQKSLANSSPADPNICSMKMALPMGILVCLVLVSMGLTSYAIAFESPLENESNDMESTIKSRSDYPDYDDLSSFFDFEIGPPSITYKDAAETKKKMSIHSRPNVHKNYYYYHSDSYPKHHDQHYPPAPQKQVVTPGTHYKSSTEKTFVEGEVKSNESKSVLNQANIGGYQVSVVDANSPLLTNLGLTQDDLAKLSGYNKRSITNASMYASDSTPSATYAENPRPNYPQSGYAPSNSHSAPAYQHPYDASKYPPPPASNYGERQYKPNDRYPPPEGQNTHRDYNHASASAHPPPQGSYDAKSYRAVQNSQPQGPNGYNYPPASYNHYPPSSNAYNNPPPPPASYSNPPPPPTSYSNPPPPSGSYNNPSVPSTSYNPQRSSTEPWRQSTQIHTDWDDKQAKKQDSWQSGPYPPHPPPLPYSSTSSNTGSYYPKPAYGGSSDKTGHRLAASYVKPESKPTYSASAAPSSEYSSHKPYYPSSSYSSSKAPSRDGSVSYAASSHHHHPAPAKPGITIRFKTKTPGHGVNIPLSLSPLDVVKKLLPLSSLNPLNNKKVTIGITIENKKDHPTEFHSY